MQVLGIAFLQGIGMGFGFVLVLAVCKALGLHIF